MRDELVGARAPENRVDEAVELGGEVGVGPFVTGVLALFVGAIGQVPGLVFRQRMDWGYKELLSGLLIPVLAAAGTIWFLWSRVGSGALGDVQPLLSRSIQIGFVIA